MEIFSFGKAQKAALVIVAILFCTFLMWINDQNSANFEREGVAGVVVNNIDNRSKPLDPQKSSERTTFFSTDCKCHRNFTIIKETSQYNSGFNWCSSEATSRGPNQKIVSFSLFGKADENGMRYFSLLNENAIRINQLLPGWIVRLYHNIEDGTPEHRLLCDVYCRYPWVDLCDINRLWKKLSVRKGNKSPDIRPFTGEQIFNLNRRIWRFLPLVDKHVNFVLTRDIDGLIDLREISALREWWTSNYTFHLMRDHHQHNVLILAGLFGAKLRQRRDLIEGLTLAMIYSGQDQKRGTDQSLLSTIFWPTVKHDVMAHDSYYCQEHWNALPTHPFPTQRINGSFVSDDNVGRWETPKKCPVACRPLLHQDWEYC